MVNKLNSCEVVSSPFNPWNLIISCCLSKRCVFRFNNGFHRRRQVGWAKRHRSHKGIDYVAFRNVDGGDCQQQERWSLRMSLYSSWTRYLFDVSSTPEQSILHHHIVIRWCNCNILIKEVEIRNAKVQCMDSEIRSYSATDSWTTDQCVRYQSEFSIPQLIPSFFLRNCIHSLVNMTVVGRTDLRW